MTAAKTERGLHAKLAEIMAEAERIPKNGRAPREMGGYPFVQVGDAADFIRKALGSRSVSMLPSEVEIIGHAEHETSRGGTMTTAELRVTWTLTDGTTGESAVIQSYGVGADTGDKYSGKAMTNAMKYALLAGFQLSTGDDVETADTSDRQSNTETVGGEALELLGTMQKAGTVVRGGSEAYKLDWREGPEGHAIGFRLTLPDDKDIPQVLVMGSIGEALYLAHPDGASLNGHRVTVKGRLYNVRQTGRRTYYRLVVGEVPDTHFIETPEVRIPALPDPDASVAGSPTDDPVEAPSAPLFADVEPLDETERALVAGGLPE